MSVREPDLPEMNPCHLRSGAAEASEGVEGKERAADLFGAGRDETGPGGKDTTRTRGAHLLVWRQREASAASRESNGGKTLERSVEKLRVQPCAGNLELKC